jgi:hypothetical protein
MNIYDMNQVSKKTLERKKKLERKAESFLESYYKKLKEEEVAKENGKQESILNNARFSNSSVYFKNKQRQKALRETIEYSSRANNAVVADALSKIVEKSLLIDEAEYAKLNPDYKKTIRETVLSFLENADLNQNITKKETLTLIEHLTKRIPEANTGIYLKEDEIIDIVNKEPSEEIESSIDTLSGDVKEKVANLVSDEQSEASEIQKTVDELVAVSEAAKAAGKASIITEDEETEDDSEEEIEVADEEEKEESSEDEISELEDEKIEDVEEKEEDLESVNTDEVEDELSEEPSTELTGELSNEEDYLETDNGHTLNGEPLHSPKTSIKVSPEGEISIDVFKEFEIFLKKEGLILNEGNLNEGELTKEIKWKLLKFSVRFLSEDSLDEILKAKYSKDQDKVNEILKSSKKEKVSMVRTILDDVPYEQRSKFFNSQALAKADIAYQKGTKLQKAGLGAAGIAGAGAVGAGITGTIITGDATALGNTFGGALDAVINGANSQYSSMVSTANMWSSIGSIAGIAATLGLAAAGIGTIIVKSVEKKLKVNKEQVLDFIKSSEPKSKKVVKEQFYHEVPKKGILESLAFNEAMEMIKEGKEYNPDLALANALTYLTILETFNSTGLLKISKEDYKKLTK